MSFWNSKPKNNNQKDAETLIGVNESSPQVIKPESALVSAAKDETLTKPISNKRRTALGMGTIIQGKLSFDTPVSIEGQLTGEIFSSTVLVVGKSGKVHAKVEASELVIEGEVKGEIRASKRVEILAGAILEGNVQSPSFIVHEGARFNGNSSMGLTNEAVLLPSALGGAASKNASEKSSSILQAQPQDGGAEDSGAVTAESHPVQV